MERIDWNLPLETDEPTPRRITWLSVGAMNGDLSPSITASICGAEYRYLPDGRPKRGQDGNPPRLRNVRALRTSDECLQRMEALVRRMAVRHETRPPGHVDPNDAEAAQIVKLLPAPPVDPDLIEARKICDAVQAAYTGRIGELDTNYSDGKHDQLLCVQMTLAGVKRGRELAHAEYAADLENPGTFYRSIDLPARP